MSRKRSILHSTERHNNRNYKRRIRNLFFEIAFIIVLTFVAIKFIKIDTLEKAKNVPCIFNNWAIFYKGEFISNTILNANSFKKLIKE